jgi:uncharacterized membrane protein HdeD (DUF308 family)
MVAEFWKSDCLKKPRGRKDNIHESPFHFIIIVGIVFIISGLTALGGPPSAVPFVHFLIGALLIGGAAFGIQRQDKQHG